MKNAFQQARFDLVLENRFLGFLLNAFPFRELQGKKGIKVWWTVHQHDLQLDYLADSPLDLAEWKTLLEEACIEFLQFVQQIITENPGSKVIGQSVSGLAEAWVSFAGTKQAVLLSKIQEMLHFMGSLLDNTERENLIRLGLPTDLFYPQKTGATINWRVQLRNFVRSGMRTAIRNSNHHYSKRYGTTPGLKIRAQPKIGIALDVSGSISKQVLESFWGEVNQIYRSHRQLIICEFDHRITRIGPFHPSKPYPIGKQGGTNFNAPVKWANEAGIQALIIFTDGQAAPPLLRSSIPCLWVFACDEQQGKTAFRGNKLFLKTNTPKSQMATNG
ncbi:MAG: hypothetical protein KDC34_07855 [Saprospiraceae bacterium]|nr:hypothetical protein [Saprospiraceae bacterium]